LCCERADYLLATWHTSHRPASIEFDPGVKWLGLEVRSHRQLDDTHAEVEFVARQKSPAARPCACTSAAASCMRPAVGTIWTVIT
jgi:uncharacterized protein YchJ